MLQDLRILLVVGEHRVAKIATGGDLGAVAGDMLAVVASTAARRLLVADVAAIGAPGDVHLREHVPVVDIAQHLARSGDRVGL